MSRIFQDLISPCTGKSRRNIYACKPELHKKCRCTDPVVLAKYAEENGIIKRTYVPDENISWNVKWPEYYAVPFTSSKVSVNPVWADPSDVTKITKWNAIDGKIDRRSHVVKYDFDKGYPLNPIGRTGISERGHLGKWGPNHAADPIVTRWKRDEKGKKIKHTKTKKPILQFVAIRRTDNNEWAIPGGMCDPGEKISVTLKREFLEEATNSLEKSEEARKNDAEHIKKLFDNGIEIYRGYVDDPRNTDNAWMETIAYNFHDKSGKILKDFCLSAGDDAANVAWMDVDSTLSLYASHKDFILKTVKLHNAHW